MADGAADGTAGGGRRLLVVHPSAELYGSDRVALESARAAREAGWDVTVALPADGPLVPLLTAAGCRVELRGAPVLRKAYLSPLGLIRFALLTLRLTPGMLRLLRTARPDVVYVSTVTVPWWLVLARLPFAVLPAGGRRRGRTRVVVHVHEAEEGVPRPVRLALAAPLLLAHAIVANSATSRDVLAADLPVLGRRTRVVYNGVPGPAEPAAPRPEPAPPVRLVLVGRVSERKGTDVAVAALALLGRRGVEATLDLVGGVFPGYEWFEEQVRAQAAAAGVADAVRWRGVQPDVWAALAAADVALVPSRVEPFGNAAVEAMLALRPVVAGDTQGLREIVRGGEFGEAAAPGDPAALADAVERLLGDWPAALERARRARAVALDLYGPGRYARDVLAVIAAGAEDPSVPNDVRFTRSHPGAP